MTNKETEKLWGEEKYRVMFFSQSHYNAIRIGMREQQSYTHIETLIEDALGSRGNACSHI